MIWSTVLAIKSVTDWNWYFWVIFCPFIPPKTPKNQNFEKMKNVAGDIIHFTHLHQKPQWGTFPGIWSETDRIFCHFGGHFLSFNLLKTWKFKILKKWKKHLEMPSFYILYQKSRSYHVCFLIYGVWQTYFFVILGHFFNILPHYGPPKIKIWKKLL